MSSTSQKNISSIINSFITKHFLEFAMHCQYISVEFICAKMLCDKIVSG